MKIWGIGSAIGRRALVLGVLLAARTALAEPPAPSPSSASEVPRTAPSDPLTGSRSGTKATPDEVLKSKGLQRFGLVYVLDDEARVKEKLAKLETLRAAWEEIQNQMGLLEQSAVQKRAMFAKLDQERTAVLTMPVVNPMLPNPIANPNFNPGPGLAKQAPNPGRLDPIAQTEATLRNSQAAFLTTQMSRLWSEVMQAQNLYSNLALQASSRQFEFDRGQAAVASQAAEMNRRYAALAVDPEVVNALTEINKTVPRKVTLGPLEDYTTNLARIASELLRLKGLKASSKGGAWSLAADSDVKSLAHYTETFQHDLALALGRLNAKEHALAAARRELEYLHQRQGRPGGRPGDLKASISKAQAMEAEIAREFDALAEEVAAKRGVYVQSVLTFRKVFDDAQKKHQAISADADIQTAIADLKRLANKKTAIRPAADPLRKYVEEVEKTIQTVEVPLEIDKSVLWVVAGLNGQAGKPFVVDPGVATVRLSTPLAAQVGALPAAGDLAVEVPMGDAGKETITARRTTLKTVAIGPLTAHDVECLVMPGNDDAPPVLGASFLNQFAYRIDAETGKLVLSQVQVKPIAASSSSNGRTKGKRAASADKGKP
jgi:predicted aspartyl protease